MRNMKSEVQLFLFLLLVMLLFTGCPFPDKTGDGVLRINLDSSSNSRTIVPVITPAITEYVLSFTGPETIAPVRISDTFFETTLKPGFWDLAIEAINSSGLKVAGEVLEGIEVLSGTTTTMNAVLEPSQLSTGSIDITVTWPQTITIVPETGILVLFNNEEYPSALTIGTNSLNFHLDMVPSGSGHILEVSLTEEGTTNEDTITEIVHVYDNLETAAVINRTEADFGYLSPKKLVIDHTAIALFDSIPQEYIDVVKTRLVILAGESHGRAYGDGLDLLEAEDARYASVVQWGGDPAEAYTASYLRMNRAFLNGTSWKGTCGEEDFWTNEAARTRVMTGLQTIEEDYTGFVYFGFGWCWDMTWLNSPTAAKDPVYGTGWAGSSVDGPQGNLPWGLDDGDYSITNNPVSLQTYLDAVDSYNAGAPGIKTIFTTGPVDNAYNWGYLNSENGYQRWLKHEAIRSHVNTNGGILLDYADILSWDYQNDQRITESWDGHSWDGANIVLATGGDGYVGSDGATHISEEACRLLGKAVWVMLALDAGWDGN